MKIEEGDRVWFDDNEVDFSRKRRVHKNHKISERYAKFSPDDMTVEGSGWEANPSVNKDTYQLSNGFNELLNDNAYLLNKGKSKVRPSGDSLDRFFDRISDDLDIN